MGYHKNQLVASQVEVGDRVPPPKPWHSHASLTRRSVRESEKLRRKIARFEKAELLIMFLGGVGLTGAIWLIIVEVSKW
jgi:hypothetical protein